MQSAPSGSSPTSDPDDPQLVESAREVMRALTKAVKASKMYLPEHDICRRFRDEFATRLARHLDEHGNLPLTIRGYEFLVGTTPVYEEPTRFENLAFRCSSDGLRELVLHQGLTRGELDAVLGVLTAESRPLDSDMVTRLWELALPHVTYQVAEVQDGPETSNPGLSSLPAPTAALAGADRPTSGTESAPSVPEPELIPETPIDSGSVVFTLTDEEIASLQQQVTDDTAQDYVEQLIDILVSILALDDDEQSFLEVLQVLDDIVATCVRQGRFIRARDIVARLLALRDDEARVSERSRELIRVVWTQLGRWERVAVLEEALNQPGTWDRDALAAYMGVLPPAAVEALITLLERAQTATGRRMVCDALEAFGAEGVEAILLGLPSAPWYVARNLIHVLGSVKDLRAMPALETAMRHAEVRIRREALKAIDALGVEHVKHALPKWLNDADEGVRLHALKLARRHAWPGLFNALSDVIADHAFVHRSEVEQREWFDALAAVGADAALPLIARYLTPERAWPWIFVTRHDPRARHAVAAARRIGTPAATALLRDAAARRGPVSDEARRALRELERAA
ncbi:MAG: HEAT repeat domain-containing protein [Nitrospirota bacterium]